LTGNVFWLGYLLGGELLHVGIDASMGVKHDPLIKRRMTYVRLHLDILFSRGSNKRESKVPKLPLQITSVDGKCMLATVSAQLPPRDTKAVNLGDPAKKSLRERQSSSQSHARFAGNEAATAAADDQSVSGTLEKYVLVRSNVSINTGIRE
jgi:hypothetical protein